MKTLFLILLISLIGCFEDPVSNENFVRIRIISDGTITVNHYYDSKTIESIYQQIYIDDERIENDIYAATTGTFLTIKVLVNEKLVIYYTDINDIHISFLFDPWLDIFDDYLLEEFEYCVNGECI